MNTNMTGFGWYCPCALDEGSLNIRRVKRYLFTDMPLLLISYSLKLMRLSFQMVVMIKQVLVFIILILLLFLRAFFLLFPFMSSTHLKPEANCLERRPCVNL